MDEIISCNFLSRDLKKVILKCGTNKIFCQSMTAAFRVTMKLIKLKTSKLPKDA